MLRGSANGAASLSTNECLLLNHKSIVDPRFPLKSRLAKCRHLLYRPRIANAGGTSFSSPSQRD